jgi:hypothetical protein
MVTRIMIDTATKAYVQRGRTVHDEQVILGVDTHADVHVATVITVLGVLLGTFVPHHGRWLCGAAGLGSWSRVVIEINRPDRAARRRRGNTDAIDAETPPALCCPSRPRRYPNAVTVRSR